MVGPTDTTEGGVCVNSGRAQRHIALLGIAALLALFGFAPAIAAAQDQNAGPPNQASIAAFAVEMMNELLTVDLDGDGVSDFDPDGDGFPTIPVGEPGDLDLRPGDGFFGRQVTDDIRSQLNEAGFPAATQAPSIGDDSVLTGNCGGMALSFDADGNMIDWALGIGSAEGGGPVGTVVDLFPADEAGTRAFTRGNPFLVEDRVVYFGRLPFAGDGPRNHTWSTETAGISIDAGGDDNPNGNNRNAGEVDIGEDTPAGGFLIPPAVYPFSGQLTSENGLTCAGEGWAEFGGNPLANVGGVTAGALGIAGIVGLLFNARPAITWRA